MINQHTAHSHGPVTWASRARGRLAYGNRKVKSEVAGQPSIQFPDGPPAHTPRTGAAVARLPTTTAARDRGHPPPIRRPGSSTAASRQGVFIRSRRRRRGRPPAREAGSSTQPDGRGAVWSFGREREKKSGLCKCREGERGQYVVGAWCVSGRCWPRSGSASLGVRSKVPASGPKDCLPRRINSTPLLK